jgi:hypothetical protein
VGEDTNQIEREIRERRSDLGRNLSELEEKARQLADWRTYYRDHPKVFLGAAIGAGVMLALTAVPKARPKAPQFESGDAEALPERDTSHDVYHVNGSTSPRNDAIDRIQREVGETWDQIANGLLHLASAKAIELVSNLVPGFSDHVERPPRPVSRTLH